MLSRGLIVKVISQTVNYISMHCNPFLKSPFCGVTDTDTISGFASQSGQPYSHLVEVHVLHIPRDLPLV